MVNRQERQKYRVSKTIVEIDGADVLRICDEITASVKAQFHSRIDDLLQLNNRYQQLYVAANQERDAALEQIDKLRELVGQQ